MDENLSDAQDRMQADKQYLIPSALSQNFCLENQEARGSPALLQTPGVMHTCAIGLTFLGELWLGVSLHPTQRNLVLVWDF